MLSLTAFTGGMTMFNAILRSCLAALAAAWAVTMLSGEAAAEPKKWTVLIYMNGKNDLEPFAIENFQELAKVGSTDNVKFVVQMGRPIRRPQGDSMAQTFDGWSGAKRFLVTTNIEPTAQNAMMDAMPTPERVNMGDPQQFEDFLRWGKARFPADRYAVVIWNHGQGYRLIVASNNINAGDGAPSFSQQYSSAGSYRSVSYDEDTRSILYNSDVRERLAAVFSRSELAVVGFDACLMAMIETAYELASVTPLLVASEELEPGRGWNYEVLARRLTGAPDMSDRAFATMLVDMYKERYGDDEETTLSVIDLDKITAAASAVSQVAEALRSNLTVTEPWVSAARQSLNAYNFSRMPVSIDAISFLASLESQLVPQGAAQRQLLDKVRAARDRLKEAVIANYASKPSEQGWGSKGVAIYFPEDANVYRRDPDGVGYAKANGFKPIKFVQDMLWADLLTAYWSAIQD